MSDVEGGGGGQDDVAERKKPSRKRWDESAPKRGENVGKSSIQLKFSPTINRPIIISFKK